MLPIYRDFAPKS
jgi:hypothetical protein